MSCAQTVELIEMPFVVLSWADPRNHFLDWGIDTPTGMGR